VKKSSSLLVVMVLFALPAFADVKGSGGDIGGGGGDVGGGGGTVAASGKDLSRENFSAFQVELIGARKLRQNGFSGKNQTVAIIDSGISGKSEAAKNLKYFHDFTATCEFTPCDGHSHGTIGADLVHQMAPAASIIMLKALDQENRGKTKNVIQAFRWVLDNADEYGIKIINLSLVSPDMISGFWNEGDDLRELIEKAAEQNIFVIAAVGNDAQSNLNVLPANSANVITVGSLNHEFTLDKSQHKISRFTNIGIASSPVTSHSGFFIRNTTRDFSRFLERPDVLAPGESVAAEIEPGSTLAKHMGVGEKNFGLVSGTSFSAFLASGGLAVLLEKHPNLKPTELQGLLKYANGEPHYRVIGSRIERGSLNLDLIDDALSLR
jgi:serine protease AprX